MLLRLAVVSTLVFMACGSAGAPDGGGTGGGSGAGGGTATGGGSANTAMCPGLPFGIFGMSGCDGGALSNTVTFFSDGGAAFSSSGMNYACGVDRLDCELLLTCMDHDDSQLSLDWTPAAERLSGLWQRSSGGSYCVELQKK